MQSGSLTPHMHEIDHVIALSYSVQFSVFDALDKLWWRSLDRVQVLLGVRIRLHERRS